MDVEAQPSLGEAIEYPLQQLGGAGAPRCPGKRSGAITIMFALSRQLVDPRGAYDVQLRHAGEICGKHVGKGARES